MRRLQIRLSFIVSIVLLVAGCKIAPPVTTDYDTNYNYQALKTFAWMPIADKKELTSLDNRRQAKAIESILGAKGFNLIKDSSKADFLLKTRTITDKKTDVEAFVRVWGYHPYFYHHPLGWRHAGPMTIKREYEVGTLVLDIVDPVKKEVIWQGAITRKLGVYRNRTPEERDELALINAKAMLSSFPPK
jgi:hypothetical protein